MILIPESGRLVAKSKGHLGNAGLRYAPAEPSHAKRAGRAKYGASDPLACVPSSAMIAIIAQFDRALLRNDAFNLTLRATHEKN